MKPKLVRGTELNDAQRKHVLNSFIWRWTIENLQRYPHYHGCSRPTIPLIPDAEWLGKYSFYVQKDGEIARTPGRCELTCLADLVS